MPEGMDQPRRDVIKDVGKIFSQSGMAVSALIPVFIMKEGPKYYWAVLVIFSISFLVYATMFWREIARNLKIPLILVLLTAGISYPFPGASFEFLLLRVPAFLMVASISAVEFDRLYGGSLRFHEQLRRVPSSIGPFSGLSGRSVSPQGSDVFGNMGGGCEAPSHRDCPSEISIRTENPLGGDLESANTEGDINLDLGKDTADRQQSL
ncbi:hypothetical protein PG984_000126 [Apiospora sp. TS-2023a]